MSNIFSKAANVVGDVIGGFTNAITGGGGMKTSSSSDGVIEKLLSGQKDKDKEKEDQAKLGQFAQAAQAAQAAQPKLMKKGGMTTSKMKSAPKVSSASKRADGIATKGKTRGKLC